MDSARMEFILTLTLKCGSNKDREKFTGIFAADEIYQADLYKPGRLRLCIVNADVGFPGSHWLVVGIDMRDVDHTKWYAFVFDSLAQDIKSTYPILYEFLHELECVEFLLKNKTPVQDKSLDTCGLHSIYFVLNMIESGSYLKVLSMYNSELPQLNDCNLLKNYSQFLVCEKEYQVVFEMQRQIPDAVKMCVNV